MGQIKKTYFHYNDLDIHRVLSCVQYTRMMMMMTTTMTMMVSTVVLSISHIPPHSTSLAIDLVRTSSLLRCNSCVWMYSLSTALHLCVAVLSTKKTSVRPCVCQTPELW